MRSCIILILILGSCVSPGSSPKNYVQYFMEEGNGLRKSATTSSWQLSLSYRNATLMALTELGTESLIPTAFESLMSEYDGLEYYLLKLTKQSSSSSIMETMEETFPFEFKHHLKLVVDRDTLSPAMYHFEGAHMGNTNYRFMLAFDSEGVGDRSLIIDNISQEESSTVLTITEESINKIPSLSL